METEQEFADWCRQTVAIVAIGGIWVVPRSGHVYKKNSETEISLVQVIGDIEGSHDREEFDVIKKYMNMAGITVIDNVGVTDG